MREDEIVEKWKLQGKGNQSYQIWVFQNVNRLFIREDG